MAYPVHSRLAAAVTLTVGVIVTGGLGSEKQVWIKPSHSNSTWNRRKDMIDERLGHGSCRVRLNGAEVVVVAGGWVSVTTPPLRLCSFFIVISEPHVIYNYFRQVIHIYTLFLFIQDLCV